MDLLLDITLIFGIAVASLVICSKLKLPSIVGLLITGIIAGPDALGILKTPEQIELLSEIGVVLLLFVVGLEFSLSGMIEIRRPFLLGGTLQMVGTGLVVGVGTFLLGYTVMQSVYLGFVVSLSSTAIVINVLQQRSELESPHGRTILGMLIFQDIAVVPLMLAAPLMAGGGEAGSLSALTDLLIGVASIATVGYVAYKWVVPWLLHMIAMTGSREAFLLGVLVICAGIAALTHEAGLSLALGAFIAGLIISESYYSHQAVAVILPFRDVFTSLFFVSVGMLLDLDYLAEHAGTIVLLTLGIIVAKPLVAAVAAFAVGLPLRNSVLTGAALGQIGEFSLVVTTAGVGAGLLTGDVFQTVLVTAVLSMMMAPALVEFGPHLADSLAKLPFQPHHHGETTTVSAEEVTPYHNHLVIIGYGVTGRNVARVAAEARIDYAVIEINAQTVKDERAKGTRIHYGDATTDAVLHHVNAEQAKAIVIVVNDPDGARRITRMCRDIAQGAYIIVRSRYIKETGALLELGADEVIADELEISIEVFSRVLARFLVPREDVEEFVTQVRSEWRDMTRPLGDNHASVHELTVEVPDLSTRSFRLTADSPLVGSSIAQSALRSQHGVAILAVRRGAETMGNPDSSLVLEAGDVLLVFGPESWDPRVVS